MKNIYLALAIIGFIFPNILVVQESLETGNWLLYAHPVATFEGLFANRISTIFAIDLIFTVLVFFFWTYQENQTRRIKNLWIVWGLTMAFGLAGGFPLFLYLVEKSKGE